MRLFRITDNIADSGSAPLVLVDDSDTVVRVGDSGEVLASIALELLGADSVAWDHEHGQIQRREP